MKRSLCLKALVLPVSLLVMSQLGCQPTTTPVANRTSTENANAAKEPVNTAAIESELTRIENDWPRVLKEKDAAAVRRVEDDDLVIIYPDGSTGSKAQDVQDIENGNLSADSWDVLDVRVKVLDNDAAVANGRSIVKGGKAKTPDGKTIDISGEYRWIDSFARRNGEWKLVASASVPVRAPAAGAVKTPSPRVSPTASTSPAVTRPSPAATRAPSPAATKAPSPATRRTP